jgi:hypothetical protein
MKTTAIAIALCWLGAVLLMLGGCPLRQSPVSVHLQGYTVIKPLVYREH